MAEVVCINCREPCEGRRTYTWSSREEHHNDVAQIVIADLIARQTIEYGYSPSQASLKKFYFKNKWVGKYNVLTCDLLALFLFHNECERDSMTPVYIRILDDVKFAKFQTEKIKHEIQQTINNISRVGQKSPRPRSTESHPRSNSQSKDEPQQIPVPKQTTHSSRPPRPERSPIKRSVIPRKTLETFMRSPRPVITVPPPGVLRKIEKLPDQVATKKCEEKQVRGDYENLCEPRENVPLSKSITQLKSTWADEMYQFEKLKYELDIRQKAIMELYATLRNTHKLLCASGQYAELPGAEDLSIMNVAKLTPEQLMQLCTGAKQNETILLDNQKGRVTIDMNKLYDAPTKLVATCEQTLIKRKEIIDWFDTLKSEDKGISVHKLTKKINEFNAENEMLNSSLQTCKIDFLRELNEIVEYLRRGLNETIALQVRSEELTYELSELNSQNIDLRKQLHASEHMKLQTNRHRVEELEKELKEEKCKKTVIRERLSRAEGQVKIGNERASQLEAALEQLRSQNWTLERTVQQLHEQNQKLQSDFDKELNLLTESIKENSTHLDEIAESREKLQTDKAELEARLQEITENYKQSLKNMKDDLNKNVAKLVEAEKKFDLEKEERKKLESKLECLCAQLLESEIRYKDVLKQLQEKDTQLCKTMLLKSELESAKRDLELANLEIEDYRGRLVKKNEAIKDIEQNFKETLKLEKELQADLKTKVEYIAELEKKQPILEQQLQESSRKMESYEQQLDSIKTHIEQLREEFGDFETISDLHDMINQQRAKLDETTRQNTELTEVLRKKNIELESHLGHLSEQENLLEERDGVIKMLTEKEEEHANIIKLLRNNLEIRAKTDTELTQQLNEKNAEIQSLISNLGTRKEQISQLEKIVLTLEEQLRRVRYQRKRDHEKMSLLEKAITDYESYHIDAKRTIETPVDNLDNLIKILEEELGTCFEPKQQEYNKTLLKKKYAGDYKNHETIDCKEHENGDISMYQNEQEKQPTKIVMGNFVKKTYIQTNDERDNLDRKMAITNIDTSKWLPNPEPSNNPSHNSEKSNVLPFRGIIPLVHPKEQYTRNLQYLISNQREEKKCKMFKFAGHRL